MADDLKLNIKADSTPLKTLAAEIRKTKEEVASAKVQFGQMSSQFETSASKLRGLQTEFKGLNSAVKEAGVQTKASKFQLLEFGENLTVVGAGVLAATSAMTAFALKTINLGAEFSVLKSNFQGTTKDLELFRKATAGTVSDSGLIKLSNQASDLGVSLKDQSLLFSLAEDAADKYGGSVEENFNKVIFAADGSAKGLRAVGIGITEFKQEVEKLTTALGTNLDALSAEEQQNIRLQAIYNLTGTNIESVKNKTQDYKDVLDSVKVAAENFMATFGGTFVKGLAATGEEFVKIADKTGLVKKDFNLLETAAVSLGIVLSKFNTIGFFTFIISQLGDVKQLIGEIGGFGFLRDGAQLSNQIAESGRGDALGQIGSLTPSTDTDATKRIRNTSRGGNTGNNKVAEQIVKAVYDDLNDQMLNLFRGGTRTARDLFSKNVPITSTVRTVTGDLRNNLNASSVDTGMSELRTQLLSTLSEAGNNLSSIVDIFGIKTETVLGQAVEKFSMILNLIESTLSLISNINTGVSIFKTLFGIGTGGGGGGAFQAGGMPRVNPSGIGKGGSNYFKIDLNTMAIVKDGLPKYNEYKGAIAVS